METFTYSFINKIIFRFGNIIVTLLLLVYLIPLIWYVDRSKILIIPIIISLIILYIVNKVYFSYYKLLPYKIVADKEKMICSNFIFSNKELTIYYKDIESLTGGVFSRKLSGMMKVCDGKNKICIGFSQKMKNSSKLITLILSNVKREIYDEVIENITAQKK